MKILQTIVYSIIFYVVSLQAQNEPKKLNSFADIFEALKSGYEVICVIDYFKTKLLIDSAEATPPKAIGGMKINAWEYFEKNVIGNEKAVIITSEIVLISHWKRGYVYNYAKLRIFEDGTLELNARYINPLTFKTEMDETFYGYYYGEKEKISANFFAR